MRIGFIGLGIMGAPMVANLDRAGFDVRGFDLAPDRPGRTAGSAKEAISGADVVITMLPDSPQVEEVLPDIVEYGGPDLLYIDMSTIDPGTSRRLAERLRALDAPVSGGERGAIEGSLSIMVGGAEEDFARALPVFHAVGKTIVHVGPPGAGQTVKAANQLVVGGTYALVAEAILLMEASGVDAAKGLDVLAGGLAGSRILELKRHSMVAREFTPGFRVDLHHKDMGIATAAARDAGLSLPLTAIVTQLVAAARAQGLGSLDHSALLKVIERINSA
ncbi:NAD(P)-dependent oxidoreductase [Nonomuraea mangrovi]|uniref:NAD(P)-dependent oxidoreductase n=1 Tax=Nonomuraea mangrovi TaxID=2316207 RepID=A0ABW4TBN4_9ACTN